MAVFRSTLFAIGAALPVLAFAPAANAQSDEGKFQIKGFLTSVTPDGAISDVATDAIGLPADAQTEASDSVVPTIAIEYFFNDNFSFETICCVTPHDVDGDGALAGTNLIDDAIILPATLTAKYHFDPIGNFKPYLGAGPTYFIIFDEGVGADAAALGATDVDLSDEFGFVLQGGVDMKLGNNGWGLSVDAKRYFVGTTATFDAGSSVALQSDHDLDPWVVSAGVTYRF